MRIHAGDDMRIEAGREEVIQYSYICDLCKKGYKHGSNCSICGIDICSSCTRFDPRDMGDYPSKYCCSCFKVGEKYLERMSIEEEKHDAIIEKIGEEWREEALKVAKNRE